VIYEIKEDSSPLEGELSSDNEALLYKKEQPYTTPGSINFKELLKQV